MGAKGKKRKQEKDKDKEKEREIIKDIFLDFAMTEAAIFRKQSGLEVAFLLTLLECLSAWSSLGAL